MTRLEIVPHPEEQRSYAELREEFRADALANLRSKYEGQHPLGWNMVGDHARDHFSQEYAPGQTSPWALEMLRWLDEPVSQDFGLGAVPFTESVKIEEQAQRALLHEQVTWEEGTEGTVDHDAPACAPVETMSDEELADYVDRSIKESERG